MEITPWNSFSGDPKRTKETCYKFWVLRWNIDGQLNHEIMRQNVLDGALCPWHAPDHFKWCNPVYRINRGPEYKRYQLVCTKRVLDPTIFFSFILRALVGWYLIKCRFMIISLNKYLHGWFSSWPPINVVVTKKRYMQMNTKERPSKPFLVFWMCMFQTHTKMNVIEHWTIQTINEEMDIPSVNDYVTHANENNGSTPTFALQIHHPVISVVKRVHLHRAAAVLGRISAIKTINRTCCSSDKTPKKRLHSKRCHSPISKILNGSGT